MAMQHMKKLVASNQGDIQLIEAIIDRSNTICELHRRVRGTDLQVPESLSTDMRRFITLANRYDKGDFRHSRAEILAARSIAQWTLDVNCELRNTPKKEIQWIDFPS